MNQEGKTVPSHDGSVSEPVIIAFCCHYCAFTAADLAGTMRLQYPPNVRIVRLPCTGKVDINMLLQAFVSGADGVMVAGCEEGSCHFIKGNLRAKHRVAHARTLLEEVGIDAERLEMYHIAASQGPLFAQRAREFTDRITGMMSGAAGRPAVAAMPVTGVKERMKTGDIR